MRHAPSTQVDQRLKYILDGNMNKDIIILGSSRGARGIIASQLQKETGLTAYDLSYPGGDIEFQEFILRSLLKYNHAPSIVVLTVDDQLEFLFAERVNFRYENLYPFVGESQVINEMVSRHQKNAILAKLLVLYRMNRSNLNLFKKQFTPFDSMMVCGSMPVSFQENKTFTYGRDSVYKISNEIPAKVNAYLKVNALCAENNIKLVVVFPPNFRPLNNAFKQRIMHLTNPGGYFYVYNTADPAYRDSSYFSDSNHLILKGAKKFTTELSSYIKSIAQKPVEILRISDAGKITSITKK